MAGSEGVSNEEPVLVFVPFEVQGHLNPLMQVANKLSQHGFSIIFLITECDYNQIVAAKQTTPEDNKISFVMVPDGLSSEDPRNDIKTVCKVTEKAIVPFAESLIPELLAKHKGRVGMVIDTLASSAIPIATKHAVPYALFWTAMAANFAIFFSMPSLVSTNAIHPDGCLKERKIVDLGIPSMPLISSGKMPWIASFKEEQQRTFYGQTAPNLDLIIKKTKWVLCNSVEEIETPVCEYLASKGIDACTIGPLQIDGGDLSLRKKDMTCMEWLDKQAEGSVIYAAYGSVATMSSNQLEELAKGLETSGMKFLWVVRDDLVDTAKGKEVLANMQKRFGDTGCVVSWCPQMDVLCHPSVACFLTHCGWNSTLDGISAGKPMICWPFLGDQFINSRFVTDVWKIGVSVLKDSEDEMVSGDDVRRAVEIVMSEGVGKELKMNAMKFKECAVDALNEEGGSSMKKFQSFVTSMKAQIEESSLKCW